ncbi:MAG: translation factor GTPase family protein [Lachnospiraceae bacterium]
MNTQKGDKMQKHICTALLAHVDAGKTTLAEAILYLTGGIRKLGRVDHQDAFLDNFAMERARGITIFSKQAEVMLDDMEMTLIDTPGHVDFSAEMERTLQILDYAVLLISGADGVQSHVETLWRLLKKYEIPTFLFINKMDQQGTDRTSLLLELQKKLDEHCIDFSAADDPLSDGETAEAIALCEESLLEQYLETGEIRKEDAARMIARRKIFPCYFGSALKLQGVQELLDALRVYSVQKNYPEEFAARVYKISRDEQGNRLTHMKITGGSLKVKAVLRGGDGEDAWEEKVNQIRVCSGSSFRAVNEAQAGMVCAVTGLNHTKAGEGLGTECGVHLPVLEPVLSYQIRIPEDCDVHQTYRKFLQLEEEEPELHITWNKELGEIYAQLMGEVQTEVLKNMISERFGIAVEFGAGSIVYKETIVKPVIGIGHFEPLRHYAEVHLLMEPGEPGSGLQFETACSEDVLDRNWQRLILTHLAEKQHIGVLTGSEITDMKITLIAGRAHQKHTEGGDFRQATYRALRQGLRSAENVLLEPVYEFRLELPLDCAGRAMTDIQKMHGSFSPMEIEGENAVLKGTAPVVTMRGYQTELISYTKGKGRMMCSVSSYQPCHNAEEVIEARGYDPEGDLENPTGSVFCAHGAGFVVDWDLVPEYAHLDTSGVIGQKKNDDYQDIVENEYEPRTDVPAGPTSRYDRSNLTITNDELEEIFTRTYGPIKREKSSWKKSRRVDYSESRELTAPAKKQEVRDEYLLVDGYNIIFSWEELNELAKVNVESARTKLMDILSNYQGYKKMNLILVFDAYRVEGGQGSVQKYHNIYVVYTKEAETADQYIEKTVHAIGRKYNVTVATSDALEQVIILGQGGRRMSAHDLEEEIAAMRREIREQYTEKRAEGKNYLFDHLNDEMSDLMEDVRLGKKTL